jgi:hypothetical protein
LNNNILTKILVWEPATSMKDSKDSYMLIRMTVTEALNKPKTVKKHISQQLSCNSHKLASMTLPAAVLTFSLQAQVRVRVSIRLSAGNILVITQAGKCLETCEITLLVIITAERLKHGECAGSPSHCWTAGCWLSAERSTAIGKEPGRTSAAGFRQAIILVFVGLTFRSQSNNSAPVPELAVKSHGQGRASSSWPLMFTAS